VDAAEPQPSGRGASLLIEHVASFDPERRPSARERLERLVGGPLARLLVGALARHPRRADEIS
jgi:hypothetical protein